MRFKIIGKEIFYSDRIWKDTIRCIPKDEQFVKTILMSRNKYPSSLIKMFELPENEKKEYDELAPKGEEALSDKVISNCRGKGLILIKKEVIDNLHGL